MLCRLASLLHPHVLECCHGHGRRNCRRARSNGPRLSRRRLPVNQLSGPPLRAGDALFWVEVTSERVSAYKQARDGASTCCCLAAVSRSESAPARLAHCSEKKPSAAAAPPPDTAHLSEWRARHFESARGRVSRFEIDACSSPANPCGDHVLVFAFTRDRIGTPKLNA